MSRDPKQLRAIAAYCRKGFRPELSTFPDYRFTNKQTGEVVTIGITTLVDIYSGELKEAARERARLKRQEKKS